MNQIAVCIGNTFIYWSSVIIFLGIAACFALTYSLYTSHGGRGSALWLLLPLALLFSVLFSRLIHWYCHMEQYAGFWRAMTDYSQGDYCLHGAILGTMLAALLVKKLGFTQNLARLFDCLAPGAALCIAFIRLSALFNSSCRSKIVVTNPLFQRLPIASGIPTVAGGTEYRFATFFVQFLVMLIVFWMLLRFFFKRRRYPMKNDYPRDGNVGLMFLLYYNAVELVLDSTRYDSSFLPINGFVSITQILCAVFIVGIFVFYSIRSVRANGRRAYHWFLWVGFFLTVAGTGVLEYLVQRHGNWYLFCYGSMSVVVFLMAFIVNRMYHTVCADIYERA